MSHVFADSRTDLLSFCTVFCGAESRGDVSVFGDLAAAAEVPFSAIVPTSSGASFLGDSNY